MADAQQPPESGYDRETLGERLRVAREARGVSAELASEQASVPIRYIRMFEEGRYPVVADPAYLTHFVRRYASYLGLDAWQASRDFIAETEPETALRRVGKKTAEPRTVEPSMSTTKGTPPPADKGKAGRPLNASSSPPSPPPPPLSGNPGGRRPRFDAGPIALIGAGVTLGLFLLNLWMQRQPQTAPIVETAKPVVEESGAAAAHKAPPIGEAQPSAPAAEAPAAAPQAEVAAPAAPAPPASAPAAEAPKASAPAPAPQVPAQAEITKSKPPSAAPAAAPAAAPPAPPPAAKAAPSHREQPGGGQHRAGSEGSRKSRVDATNKASDELRAEQLERLKAKTAGGGAPASGGPGGQPANAPPPAAAQ